METTLCTINELKSLTSISLNMDVELLQPHLLIAQQLHIAPVLGDALYSDILNQYDNQTISGSTLTLLNEYIIPALAYAAWYSAAPFLAYKTQRSGIQALASPDNTPVTVEELSLYIARVETMKNFYIDRMEKYLITYASSFPLYRQDCVDVSSGGSSGIFLGFKRRYN